MSLTVINTGIFSVNSLVIPIGNNECFVVDPAGCSFTGDENKIVDYLKSKNLICVEIVLTHSHFDHITGIASLKQAFPDAHIAIHEEEFGELQNPPGPMGTAIVQSLRIEALLQELAKQPNADTALKDGDDVFGWKVIHTPGHTPGSICLYNKNYNGNGNEEKGSGVLIAGDTIFNYGSYGRTDFPGGSNKDMASSLRLLKEIIPNGTRVFPGHDSYDFPFNGSDYSL